MSDVPPVKTVDEEGLATAAPCETEALLGSVALVAIAEGIDDMEGAWEAEGVNEEWAPGGIVVLDATVGAQWGMKEVFIFVIWPPCNSFLANIANWNKRLQVLYSLESTISWILVCNTE
jgi:hypothetical protein